MASALELVIGWALNQSEWLQDATRRFLKSGQLSNTDLGELYLIFKREAGLLEVSKALKGIPPSVGTVSGAPPKKAKIVLSSITAVGDIGSIEPNSQLEFAPTGLTVVFGYNGSGKSSFARVLKKACGARDASDPVLPDVFKSGAKGPPRVKLTFTADGKPEAIDWTVKDTAISELTGVAVFDGKCARALINDESEVLYVPYGVDTFGALKVVIDDFQDRLTKEKGVVQEINSDKTAPGTTAAAWLFSLSKDTKDSDIDKWMWLPADEADYLVLNDRVHGVEAAKRDAELLALRQARDDLDGMSDKNSKLIKLLIGDELEQARQQRVEKHAAQIAWQQATSKPTAEPLPGVPKELAWQLLYKAAETYATSFAHPGKQFPQVGEDAICVLCMRPLDAESRERFNRFKTYMTDQTHLILSQKTKALESLVTAVNKVALPADNEYTKIKDRLPGLSGLAWDEIADLSNKLSSARSLYVEWLNDSEQSKNYTMPVNQGVLDNAIAAIKTRITALETEQQQSGKEKATVDLREMESRKTLVDLKDKIKERRDALLKNSTIDVAKAALSRAQAAVTSARRDIIEKAYNDELKEKLDTEMEELGCDHIKMHVALRGASILTMQRMRLDMAGGVKISRVSDILSEGEERVLAISGFLAELNVSAPDAPIVFDDPVSSLDHIYKANVGRRLAEEAKKRQIILFTHNIEFLFELRSVLSGMGGSAPAISVATVRRYKGFSGVVSKEGPWEYNGTANKLDKINKEFTTAKALYPGTPDEYLKEIKNIYCELRACYELMVEKDFFSGVVTRYDSQIRVENVARLGLDKAFAAEIVEGRRRCHDWITAHSKPDSATTAVIAPALVKKEIDTCAALAENIKKSNQAQKVPKAQP
ncbi:MAG TPA: AAA family ATPase [Ktedonobacteraceae bacterium]|nr:AAA family ATPase [Ktedonobacteraceae bacterium]